MPVSSFDFFNLTWMDFWRESSYLDQKEALKNYVENNFWDMWNG